MLQVCGPLPMAALLPAVRPRVVVVEAHLEASWLQRWAQVPGLVLVLTMSSSHHLCVDQTRAAPPPGSGLLVLDPHPQEELQPGRAWAALHFQGCFLACLCPFQSFMSEDEVENEVQQI